MDPEYFSFDIYSSFTAYKPCPYPKKIPDGNTVLLFSESWAGVCKVIISEMAEMIILDLVFTGLWFSVLLHERLLINCIKMNLLGFALTFLQRGVTRVNGRF